MKIIFLDIDGVLNGYDFWSLLGWRIAAKLGIKNWYRKHTRDIFGVHEEKVKRLAKIVKKTDAKIVMSSSWKHYFWRVSFKKKEHDQKVLAELFKKYGIVVIGITPDCNSRDEEILTWLKNTKNIIDNFIILDDENSFMKAFWDDERFIQTSVVPRGKYICGHWYENTGLKQKHVRKAIRVLNRGRGL